MYKLILFFVFLTFCCTGYADDECGENECYHECGKNDDISCLTWAHPPTFSGDCVPGCYCQEGFVQWCGKCMEPKDCPIKPRCYQNETFKTENMNCRTCNDLVMTKACAKEEAPNCYCSDDFVKEEVTGKCMKIEDCPCYNDPNSIFSNCAPIRGCQVSCQNRNRVCSTKCTSGCVCKVGYILNEETGKCIPLRQCQEICPRNEVYTSCKPSPPITCHNYRTFVQRGSCVPGCTCTYGYVRDDNNKCIKISDCPKICDPIEVENVEDPDIRCAPDQHPVSNCDAAGKNCKKSCVCNDIKKHIVQGRCVCKPHSTPNSCADRCHETCGNTFLYKIPCSTMCQPGCQCDPGYVDYNGNCIERLTCPKRCPANSVFKECASACRKSCKNLYINSVCTKQCTQNCDCDEGYVWTEHNQCVRPEDCNPSEVECPAGQSYGCAENKRCDDLNVRYLKCNYGCWCKGDLVYNSETRTCVTKDQCPTTVTVPEEQSTTTKKPKIGGILDISLDVELGG